MKIDHIRVTCRAADLLSIDTLVQFQGELKKLSAKNMRKLQASILKHGFTAPIFVWEHDGRNMILDGHQRLAALLDLRAKGYDIPLLPVAYIEAKDEREAKEKLLYITSQYGEFTMEGLDAFITEAGLDLSNLGDIRLVDGEFSMNQLDVGPDTEGDDEVVEQVPPVTQAGDLYQLSTGDQVHRVLCGDSTSHQAIDTLLNGTKADLWLTDPPYNVAYEGKTADKLTIQNDKMENGAFREFLVAAFGAAAGGMKSGASFYIWHADSEGYNFRGACTDNRLLVKQCLIWNKNSLVMGRQDYQWKHEPCLYGWKEGGAHSFYGDRTLTTVYDNTVKPNIAGMKKEELVKMVKDMMRERSSQPTTVIDFDRPNRNAEHPTMKPVDLFAYQMKNSSKGGDIVLDTFLGSGTTIIAAEKLGRSGYGTELDPHYCDVIVRRFIDWARANGRTPAVLRNGEPIDLALFEVASGEE
jgi:DNA modification methylase